MKNSNSIIKHFTIIGGGTFLNLLIGLLTTPIITRIVDPGEYGQWSVFTMYASIGLMIFCMGMDQSLVRFYYKDNSEKYKRDLIYICWRLPFAVALISGLMISILVYAGVLRFEFSAEIVVILCIHTIVLIFNRFGQLTLRVSYKSSLYSITTILQKIVYVSLVLAGVKLVGEQYLLIMVISTVVSYAVPAFVAIYSQRNLWKPDLPIDTGKIKTREIVIYGLPFILSLGITTIFQSIDKISLNYFCSYSEVGIYSSAMTLVHIFAIFQTTFNTMWTPMATEHYEKNPTEKTFYQKGNQYITILMFGLGLSLIFVKDIFSLLLGSKYREAAFILPFLVFNPIMYTISESTCMGIGFAKKTKMNIVVAVVACITNIIGNVFLVPMYGGRGAAISTGLSYIVFWLMRTVISNKYFYVNYKLGKFGAISFVTVLYAAYNTFHSFDWICAVGYVACIALLLILYRQPVLEMINLGIGYVKGIVARKSLN